MSLVGQSAVGTRTIPEPLGAAIVDGVAGTIVQSEGFGVLTKNGAGDYILATLFDVPDGGGGGIIPGGMIVQATIIQTPTAQSKLGIVRVVRSDPNALHVLCYGINVQLGVWDLEDTQFWISAERFA